MFTATPDQVQLGFSILVIVLLLHVFLGACAYSIMLDGSSAWMQDRVGPIGSAQGLHSRSPTG